MKRIFVLCLALIFTVGSLAVPSYAASANKPSVVNFLNAVDYVLNENGSYSKTLATPYTYVWRPGNITWEWPIFNTQHIDRLVFNIVSDVVPTSVQFSINNTNWTTLYYVSSEGKNHQYIMFNAGAITGSFFVKVNYPSTFDGYTGLSSVYGIVSDSIQVTNITYFSNAITKSIDYDEWGQPLPGFNDPVSVGSGSNVALPVVSSWYGPSTADNVLDHGEFFGKVSFSDTFRYMDSASMVIYSCGEISSYGARLEDSSGSIYSGLDCTLTYCGETQMLFDMRENMERIHMYILTVDLIGFDLGSKVLSFDLSVDPVFSSSVSNYEYGFYIQVDAVSLSPMTDEVPWYSIFGAWLSRQYTSIKSTIVSVKDGIVSSLTSGFNRLAELLGASGNSDQFQDEVNQQGDRLDQMDDVLNSVTKPALDRVDTDISGIVSDTDLSNVAHVYTYVIDDNIMAPALTMVTILAMMSFALFGKR